MGAPKHADVFRGWGARITVWNEGTRPKLSFGKWEPAKDRTGGTVVITCVEVGEVLLMGANAPGMDRRDKTTWFGRVMREREGNLTVRRLKAGEDARQQWLTAGESRLPAEICLKPAVELLARSPERGTTAELQLISDTIASSLDSWHLRIHSPSMDRADFMERATDLQAMLDSLASSYPELNLLTELYEAWFGTWKVRRSTSPTKVRV